MAALAPIALFVYDRPEHTRRVLETLTANPEAARSRLVVYADGPTPDAPGEQRARIDEVRRLVQSKPWCGEVDLVARPSNVGMAESIVSGVGACLDAVPSVIVIEDDLILSPGFLRYMNDALVLYADDEQVMHVSAYMFPVRGSLPETFFFNSTSCWGWGTWRRAWRCLERDPALLIERLERSGRLREFNLDGAYDFESHLRANATGEMSTWAVRWYASVFLARGLCLHPGRSLVRNAGHDGTGTHCAENQVYLQQRLGDWVSVDRVPLRENLRARARAGDFLAGVAAASLKGRLRRRLRLAVRGARTRLGRD
ncbi:MAG: hypothetical protein OXT09_20965 [Myxococcales bacterium]|nr:hypothetical protein [Myxococcales bacterium]